MSNPNLSWVKLMLGWVVTTYAQLYFVFVGVMLCQILLMGLVHKPTCVLSFKMVLKNEYVHFPDIKECLKSVEN